MTSKSTIASLAVNYLYDAMDSCSANVDADQFRGRFSAAIGHEATGAEWSQFVADYNSAASQISWAE